MTRLRLVALFGAPGLWAAAPSVSLAQQFRPLPGRWVAAEFAAPPLGPAPHPVPDSHPRANRVLIGGVLGAVAGVITCQLISSAVNSLQGDPNTGCTTRGNVQFAVGGAVVGGFIGWATYHKPPT